MTSEGYRAYLGASSEQTLPWLGGRRVMARDGVQYRLDGPFPEYRGWWRMLVTGRIARVLHAADQPELDLRGRPTDGRATLVHGRKLSGQFIAAVAHRTTTLADFLGTCPALPFLPEHLREGLVAVRVVHWGTTLEGVYLYAGEDAFGRDVRHVQHAYEDRAAELSTPGATPEDRAAFRALVLLREEVEAEALRARARQEAAARAEALADLAAQGGTAAGRRAMAQVDFAAAAQTALQLSGASLLDARAEPGTGAWIVRWRWQGLRLECTVDTDLRVLDAGICLTDHDTGESFDRVLSLESLPSVVAEAERRGLLHVWRRG